jgi:hypothetical protein
MMSIVTMDIGLQSLLPRCFRQYQLYQPIDGYALGFRHLLNPALQVRIDADVERNSVHIHPVTFAFQAPVSWQ